MPDANPSSAVRDEWLVVRCQLGEREAFDELVARWHPALWRYAVKFTNDAEAAGDVVQDVWLRAVRGLSGLRDAARFRAWLFGIARRVLMDRLRVRYAEPSAEPIDGLEVAEPPGPPDREDDLAQLEGEIASLPPYEREVIVLFYLNELSLTDIAEIAGIPVGTVKSRLFRARRLLRHQMAARGSHE